MARPRNDSATKTWPKRFETWPTNSFNGCALQKSPAMKKTTRRTIAQHLNHRYIPPFLDDGFFDWTMFSLDWFLTCRWQWSGSSDWTSEKSSFRRENRSQWRNNWCRQYLKTNDSNTISFLSLSPTLSFPRLSSPRLSSPLYFAHWLIIHFFLRRSLLSTADVHLFTCCLVLSLSLIHTYLLHLILCALFPTVSLFIQEIKT